MRDFVDETALPEVRVALQGGGALGAYGAGALMAFDEAGIKITEGSGLSAGALNLHTYSHAGREGLGALWQRIGQNGDNGRPVSAMSKLAELNPLYSRSFIATAYRSSGMATPLGYIKSALTDAIDTHRLQQKKIEKIHITTVTKDDLSGGFNPSNLTEHTHTSDHHSMEVLMATSALKVIADVESGGCVTIDDVPHWDGVYSRRNPSLDMFDTPTESPLIVVSVDQKDVKLSMTDSDIVYGLIHEEVERYRQFGRSPLYHINLQHKEHWGARIRTKPSAALVEELLAEGFQDAQACIEQMRIDYSPSLPKPSPYAELAI